MKKNLVEIFAALMVVLVLAGTPMAISYNSPYRQKGSTKIINLTAVSAQGIWTEDVVDGTNCWNKNFRRANVILVKGEEVILRFTSVDVTHTFYAPEIGLGPVVVEAGHFYDVRFRPKQTGKFTYYCTSACGHCHFYMSGYLFVLDKSEANNPVLVKKLSQDTIRAACCMVTPVSKMNGSPFVMRGKSLFKDKGCFTCHGENGRGGIYNPNYALKYIPTLNTLADKLHISDKDEADEIIKLLEKGADLEKINDNPPFPSYSRFYAQYTSINKKILDGAAVLQKADTTSFNPPLCMPSWKYHLSGKDINSIIAYLINIYDWENN
jgi:hypothetical protein